MSVVPHSRPGEPYYRMERHRVTDMEYRALVNRHAYVKASIRRIVANFDPNALGVFELAMLDGALLTVDGGHRRAACMEVGYSEPVECKVWHGLTLGQIAAMFRLLNTRTLVPALEDFVKAVASGAPDESAIDGIVRSYGLEIGPSARGNMSCASALLRVYGAASKSQERYPERLSHTIAALHSAYGEDHDGYHNLLVSGMGRFYGVHTLLDPLEVGRKLRTKGTPAEFLRSVELLHEATDVTKIECTAYKIVEAFNVSRKSRRLPNWPLG